MNPNTATHTIFWLGIASLSLISYLAVVEYNDAKKRIELIHNESVSAQAKAFDEMIHSNHLNWITSYLKATNLTTPTNAFINIRVTNLCQTNYGGYLTNVTFDGNVKPSWGWDRDLKTEWHPWRPDYQLGLREDGVVVWRKVKP